MIGGVTRLGGLPGLPGRVTRLAGVAFMGKSSKAKHVCFKTLYRVLRVQITAKSNNYCSLLITTEHHWITWRRWKTSSGHTWCHGCQIKWEKLVSFPPKKEQLRYVKLHAVKHIPTLRRSVIAPIPIPMTSFLAIQNGRRLRTFIYV